MIDLLIKLNKKAQKNGDVPVSCVIVKDGKIISSAYNMKVKRNDPTAHAEILAIKKAANKLRTFNLMDCELYVTLKPCKMCECVINEARIKKVYYIVDRQKNVNNTINFNQIESSYYSYFSEELSSFFKRKR